MYNVYYSKGRLKFQGVLQLPTLGLGKETWVGLPVLQSELGIENFGEAAQPRSVQQNNGSSEAALKCFLTSETVIAAQARAIGNNLE